MKITGFLRKSLYSIRANLLELIVNIITVLLIPKFLGDAFEQYGYFQVYLFYIAYVGFFHLGWCDGILLRYGGFEYNKLDKRVCSFQFRLISLIQILFTVLVIVISIVLYASDLRFVYIMVALNIVVYTPRRLLQYYLQSTNRIKEYSRITEIGRGTFGLLLIVIFIAGIRDYRYIIYADLFGKTLALVYSIFLCRDIVFAKTAPLRDGLSEAYRNVSVGIKLLFANVASMLITGIVRWGIQMKWDIATYGKISFSLSVSNFILSFISAIAVVLYPTLKRIDKDKLPLFYNDIRNSLMLLLFTCLLAYYPIKVILVGWLPQYEISIRYMAILFPVCVYASKMSLLVQTYLNIFRQETKLMQINIAGVIIAAITTYISIFLFESLVLAMLSIVFNQMFRCIYAETIVSKKINVDVVKDVVTETAIVLLFIFFNSFIGGYIGLSLYIICYAFYLFNKKEVIKELFNRGLSIVSRNTERSNIKNV